MKISSSLVVCVGCIIILQTKSLENLAEIQEFHEFPTQSSSYDKNLYEAKNAINGKFEEEGEANACSFTIGGEQNTRAWWKLPLTQLCHVEYLLIYFRSSTVNRHVGFSVYVFNESNFVPPSSGSGYTVFSQDTTTCPHRVMNITVNRLTKGIALYNAKEPPVNSSCSGYVTFATIDVCEVQVLGCCNKEFKDICKPCNPKCFNNLCDSHNGSCINGCSNANKKAPNCTKCIIGYYGNDCHRSCGHCKNGTHCDSTTGKCPDGCEKHWNGSNCDSCKNGYYGFSCSLECSHCKMGTNCNNTTGICEAGCEENWREPKCDVCQDGYYGEECKFACGKCKSEAFCDNTTGDCHNGCQENWLGSRCDICLEGFYGKYCDLACSKSKVGTLCNNITGECPEGCEFNWQGPKCDIRKKGMCGSNCTQLCDLCRNESVCNNITGECSQGCKDHWNGSRDDGFYSIIANAILAFLLAVTIALIVFQRRRISARQYDRQMMDQHHIYQGENRSHNYDNLGVLEETHEYTCLDSARELHFQDSSVL
uniref:Multiple epidermal growth factor-like domains protein 6 isoform X2 n=1 Tax=Crassostrea virginica TaxID=6565 RepID=A0A8B8C842_CRAVI|nr:multiple epidermal growth factor-like domains protein 6 isoform X2 [Crassostrea virginica]